MLNAMHGRASTLWKWTIAALVLLGAARLGLYPSQRSLVLLFAAAGTAILLVRPVLGLPALVVAALAVPLELGTGTAVPLNPATLLVSLLLLVWLARMLIQGRLAVARSDANGPLLVFVLAGLGSLLIGNVLWDPAIPKASNFWLVQLAQWAIIAFSAGAFWLTANLVEDETWLERLTFSFLLVGGALALGRALPFVSRLIGGISTIAMIRAPFWLLLVALGGGQLLFNHRLTRASRLLLMALLGVVAYSSFVLLNQSRSTWVGVGVAAGALVWLRWPRLRWPVIVLLLALTVSGLAFSALWEFAGGDQAWLYTGAPRLVLIERVASVTMRNPITGLGPASYRPYANAEPLKYRGALWVNPNVSSHNNYVDLFAHIGILGLGLFGWFAVEVARLGLRLRSRFTEGFAAGYVNGMVACGAGALILMLFADWILPFVYNIGFPGFQASVLVWLFMGGLVAVDHFSVDAAEG